MRILLHDFSGHPFQAQLARSLAARGHDVHHVQCASYPSGKGSFEDDGGASFEAISLGRDFERYRASRRLLDEVRYGVRFVGRCRAHRPDVVISCNDPLAAKAIFGLWARLARQRWVFWLQDIYSVAMAREAERRSPLGRLFGQVLQRVERWLLHRAGGVVSISEDFGEILDRWGVDPTRRAVIENWAPLEELPLRPRDNAWARRNDLVDRFVFLYAGTLGLKHDPGLLRGLAQAEPDSEVVVVSEGLGADQLRRDREEHRLDNLRVLDYQPWEELPDVLATADVLVVLLEADAGVYSVPSKILTSLCAGRAILASIPGANLGARTIETAGAGHVAAPGEAQQFTDAARRLRSDDRTRLQMGAAARDYAERVFDIGRITDHFESVLEHTVAETRQETI